MFKFFSSISKSKEDDGVIDYDEFCLALGIGLGLDYSTSAQDNNIS